MNARKLISDLDQKYSHYLKESCVTTTLHKLKDTVKLATSKLEELEVVDNKTHPNTTCQLKDYRELTQDLLGENNQELNHTILNPKLHKNLATMGRIEASESENTNQDTIGDNAHKIERDRNNQDSEEDSIYNCLSLERGPKGLTTYCKARKRKSSEKAETQRPVTNEGDTPAEKRTKLPCKVCAETTHPTLLGCLQLKKYIPS